MKPYYANPSEVECFKRQRILYSFGYQCSDCVHMKTSSSTCSLEYPNTDLMNAEGFLEEEGQFVFCKYFELS